VKILGITGGVGAGKSTVLRYLEKRYHAGTIELDALAASLQMPGKACYGPIVELFSEDILHPDRTLDREKIARIVFDNPELLEKLNEIVHPAVKEETRRIIRQIRERGEAEPPFLVIEAALLIDDHYDEICDDICYLYAPQPVRRKRLRDSRGYTDEQIDRMFHAQRSEDSFRMLTDFTIDNSDGIVQNTYELVDRALREHGYAAGD